jgi:hypothetical protein
MVWEDQAVAESNCFAVILIATRAGLLRLLPTPRSRQALTTGLAQALPSGQNIITHAKQTPAGTQITTTLHTLRYGS